MRRMASLAAALFVLVAVALPASAANEVSVKGSTVQIKVPVEIRGALPEGLDPAQRLSQLAQLLAKERLHGCFGVKTVLGEGTDPHVINVLPQRPGQFLRPSLSGDADPYTGTRELTVGALGFEGEDPLAGPIALLLTTEPPAAGRDPVRSLLASIIEESGVSDRLKPCAWKGTLELNTTYEKYHLTISATVPFTFTVNAAGKVVGSVGESTRTAVVDDDQVGHCSGSGLEMFKIALAGTSEDDGTFGLVFTAKSNEPDFHLSCSRGTVDIAGDYLRATFAPLGSLPFRLKEKEGATGSAHNTQQGRDATAKVTISRA